MTEHYVGWWNLENLFDVEDSMQRPQWLRTKLRNELAGWNRQILDRKISQLAKIISQMNGNKGPDILGVCEVENQPVVQRLAGSLSSLGRDYRVAHHDASDQRGIDVAFIYDAAAFALERQFFHVVLKRTGTRDLFQVNLRSASGKLLILIGNHWPSRTGGQFESEPYRIVAAETLSYWHERILEEKGEDAAILVMGDFNDEPHNRSLTNYALSTNTIMKVRNSGSPRLYNLMWPLMGNGLGSFYYDNFPNMLDQFLVSRGFLNNDAAMQVKSNTVRIETFPEMVSGGDYPDPIPFGRPAEHLNTDGFSDHYPISVVLQEI
jgi:predicted extracellular nuclease